MRKYSECDLKAKLFLKNKNMQNMWVLHFNLKFAIELTIRLCHCKLTATHSKNVKIPQNIPRMNEHARLMIIYDLRFSKTHNIMRVYKISKFIDSSRNSDEQGTFFLRKICIEYRQNHLQALVHGNRFEPFELFNMIL